MNTLADVIKFHLVHHGIDKVSRAQRQSRVNSQIRQALEKLGANLLQCIPFIIENKCTRKNRVLSLCGVLETALNTRMRSDKSTGGLLDTLVVV